MRLFAGTKYDRPSQCERCGKSEVDCRCPPEPKPASKQTARVRLEKRSKGKKVTTIRDLDDTGQHLSNLLKRLKHHCGAGGTVQDGIVEVQGEHLGIISEFLKKEGYNVR